MILQTVEIPNYIRRVKLSDSRKFKFYEKGKLPKAKTYLNDDQTDINTTKYEWQRFGTKYNLVDLSNGERVIANPRAAGTPRLMVINGQKIYNGEASPHIRNKVLSTIKESFSPYIDGMEVIDKFPIKIILELHDTIREDGSGSLWDVDNRSWPYIKAFQDCLTGNKDKTGKNRCKQIIPDDNILFIPSPPAVKFIPVDKEEDRKLVFIIMEETDVRIVEHEGFCKELKEYGFKRISTGCK